MSRKLRWTAALLCTGLCAGAPGTEVELSAGGGRHTRSQGGCEGQRWGRGVADAYGHLGARHARPSGLVVAADLGGGRAVVRQERLLAPGTATAEQLDGGRRLGTSSRYGFGALRVGFQWTRVGLEGGPAVYRLHDTSDAFLGPSGRAWAGSAPLRFWISLGAGIMDSATFPLAAGMEGIWGPYGWRLGAWAPGHLNFDDAGGALRFRFQGPLGTGLGWTAHAAAIPAPRGMPDGPGGAAGLGLRWSVP